jgi:hypothetical protein
MTLSRKSLLASSILALALLAVSSTAAFAQATHTYVSGTGDDAFTCSSTDPCKTWAGAISKTAAGGIMTALDPGGFGSVTINKSMTIDGGPNLAGILGAGTFGITVNAAASDVVVLRNLSIEGFTNSTYGIRILSAAAVHIENTTISYFGTRGVLLDAQAATRLTILNSAIKQCAYGLEVHAGHGVIERLTLQQNGNGIVLSGPSVVAVRNSSVSGSQMGFTAAYNPQAKLTVENSTATGNTWGIVAGSGATVRVANSRIVANMTTGLYNDGASFIVSMGGNVVTGNTTDGAFTSTITIR